MTPNPQMGAKDQVSMFSCKLLRLRTPIRGQGVKAKTNQRLHFRSEAVNSIVGLSTNTTFFTMKNLSPRLVSCVIINWCHASLGLKIIKLST